MATVTFQSNQSVTGTSAADSMTGIAPAGNFNDVIYGLEGNDTINSQNGISDSTVFGGQGDDVINPIASGTNRIANDAIYGNFGNDVILLAFGGGDRLYGGQGNDVVVDVASVGDSIFGNQGNDILQAINDTASVLFGQDGDDALAVGGGTGAVVYGNLGNDTISASATNSVLFGGHGNDLVTAFTSDHDAIYGNFENDLLIGTQLSNSVEYGGQGDDTMWISGDPIFARNTNDSMSGGLGNDLFVASDLSGPPNALNPNDIVTVLDFLSGSDHLSLSSSSRPLTKIAGNGDNAAQAEAAANDFYAAHKGTPSYVYVYGGAGAGYLFYNDGNGGAFAASGFALIGVNGEQSINATDLVPSNLAGGGG